MGKRKVEPPDLSGIPDPVMVETPRLSVNFCTALGKWAFFFGGTTSCRGAEHTKSSTLAGAKQEAIKELKYLIQKLEEP